MCTTWNFSPANILALRCRFGVRAVHCCPSSTTFVLSRSVRTFPILAFGRTDASLDLLRWSANFNPPNETSFQPLHFPLHAHANPDSDLCTPNDETIVPSRRRSATWVPPLPSEHDKTAWPGEIIPLCSNSGKSS